MDVEPEVAFRDGQNRSIILKKTLRTLKKIGAGLTLATMLTTAGNATISNWDPDTLNLQPTSGRLSCPGGILRSFSWKYDGFANPDTLFTGTITILGNRNLKLGGPGVGGTSTGVGNAPITHWYNLRIGPTAENHGIVQAGGIHPAGPSFGKWFGVPEPTTIIAGALLLLPFAASTLRSIRKNRTA